MLEKFRAARQEPAFEQQRLKRIAVNEARAFRAADAKKVREAELAAQARRAAELAAHAHREAEQASKAQAAERDAALAVEQKAERGARYAARKTAKKIRRRGY
jgi:hypothetical protein